MNMVTRTPSQNDADSDTTSPSLLSTFNIPKLILMHDKVIDELRISDQTSHIHNSRTSINSDFEVDGDAK